MIVGAIFLSNEKRSPNSISNLTFAVVTGAAASA
jgi:hypothetical protein